MIILIDRANLKWKMDKSTMVMLIMVLKRINADIGDISQHLGMGKGTG